ncbi:hypothetical protein AKJ29_17665 [Aliiroseovarius crassostreae]|uniref:Uncharacterized protein n=1 Tax=Aliiroseovarius crassostreae TaxID=154981 RepID=A0A0P7IK71_9RHOB|nr:hypothetical protein AKJ29_17665 [Aliiroseovarius crassostreae]
MHVPSPRSVVFTRNSARETCEDASRNEEKARRIAHAEFAAANDTACAKKKPGPDQEVRDRGEEGEGLWF